jgi:methylmalonyl-CoA mutase cobalamin-binding domain/chain
MVWHQLKQAILKGENKLAVQHAKQLLTTDVQLKELLEAGLTKTLESLGHKCMTEEFNLLEILLAGRAMMDVVDQVILPCLELEKNEIDPEIKIPKIIIGTIQGDIHDLGKNITRTMFQCAGYRVVDLGKDVPPLEFALAAKEEKADCIGVSSLISTTIPLIKEIKRETGAVGLKKVLVMAGGAVMAQCQPEDLGVDVVARDVFDGLNILNRIFRGAG